jgi:DNA primase small subunit
MLRHKGFKSKGDLSAFLEGSAPLDAYYSCAYYDDPEAEMDKKGWRGADLVFDIDADHIPTSCGKVHDEWVCGKCGFVGKGIVPEECPACEGQKLDVKTWPCESCLESAKDQTIKLMDILLRDFGFSQREMHVFFSGHRGYHVHVETEAVKELGSSMRKEIVDYICGLGLDLGLHGLSESSAGRRQIWKGPRLDDPGWRGRIAKSMSDFLSSAERENYKDLGLKKSIVERIIRNKDELLKSLDAGGSYGAMKGIVYETWRKMLECSAFSAAARIDTVVTTDIHRLIRLPDALHSKTGFKKVEFSMADIKEFDPFRSAIAFKKGAAILFVSEAPKFRIGDEAFGPYKNQKVELPTAAAMLLVCRNRAGVVE